jgi:DNA-binding transcriptional MerR regulator
MANSLYLSAADITVDPTDDGKSYTIDELAALTKVASRTIRFYQARGILDRPMRAGRKAFYTTAHVKRLELIARLQDRGMRLRGMKQLLTRRDSDAAVAHWLGLSDKLSEPWSEDRARAVDEAEINELIGDRPTGTLTALVDAGLVERREEAPHYYLPSPGLLEVALRLLDAGISSEELAAVEPILRDGLRRAADGIVAFFAARGSFDSDDDGLTDALDALRAQGANAVGIIFGQEIERSLQGLLESPVRKRERSRRRNRGR